MFDDALFQKKEEKNCNLIIRLTPREKQWIRETAEQRQLTITQFIHELIRQEYEQSRKMSNNTNDLVKPCRNDNGTAIGNPANTETVKKSSVNKHNSRRELVTYLNELGESGSNTTMQMSDNTLKADKTVESSGKNNITSGENIEPDIAQFGRRDSFVNTHASDNMAKTGEAADVKTPEELKTFINSLVSHDFDY